MKKTQKSLQLIFSALVIVTAVMILLQVFQLELLIPLNLFLLGSLFMLLAYEQVQLQKVKEAKRFLRIGFLILFLALTMWIVFQIG